MEYSLLHVLSLFVYNFVKFPLPVYLAKGIFHLRVLESSPTGSAVGRVKANDLDVGKNAEVEYSIVPGDGGGMFEITTNEQTQEGIITLREVGWDLGCAGLL